MRIPFRKPGKFSGFDPDLLITKEKFGELKNKLDKLKVSQPKASAEVARLAELGDFSENAEYQMAKGRLRGILHNIFKLEYQLDHSQIINTTDQTDTVQIGHKVTVVNNDNKEKTYQILGSIETNPQAGVISRHSPLGSELIGKSVGDEVKIPLSNKIITYKIIKIE